MLTTPLVSIAILTLLLLWPAQYAQDMATIAQAIARKDNAELALRITTFNALEYLQQLHCIKTAILHDAPDCLATLLTHITFGDTELDDCIVLAYGNQTRDCVQKLQDHCANKEIPWIPSQAVIQEKFRRALDTRDAKELHAILKLAEDVALITNQLIGIKINSLMALVHKEPTEAYCACMCTDWNTIDYLTTQWDPRSHSHRSTKPKDRSTPLKVAAQLATGTFCCGFDNDGNRMCCGGSYDLDGAATRKIIAPEAPHTCVWTGLERQRKDPVVCQCMTPACALPCNLL